MRTVLLKLCTALRSSPSHAEVQFTGCSAMSNLARAGTWLHVRQCACVCVCACVRAWCTYPEIHNTCSRVAAAGVQQLVEQGAVDLLYSSLSTHKRHQGVQAVALRTLVLLTEGGEAVCGCVCVCVCACVCVCVRVCVRVCVCMCVCVRVLLIVVLCTCVYSIYIILFQDQLFKSLGIQSCIWCTLAWCTAIFVNSTTELGLSQMRVKGLEAVCERSLQLFREGPVVPASSQPAQRKDDGG